MFRDDIKHETGSVAAFDANWCNRPESDRYHFTRGTPENQIQFAFQSHWRVFRCMLGNVRTGRVLEVGSGRGSMGAFFADAGFDVDLLDTSPRVLEVARENFAADRLACRCVCGDALALPYRDESFDAVVSIGLLEHFSEINVVLREQLRVLRPGGVLLAYVVPQRAVSVQTLAAPINGLLKAARWIRTRVDRAGAGAPAPQKEPLFRNDYAPRRYVEALPRGGAGRCGTFGMFPFPLVSHSPSFPFSLMSPRAERLLVRLWRMMHRFRSGAGDPWICPSWWGLAFLVWARKPKAAQQAGASNDTSPQTDPMLLVPSPGKQPGSRSRAA